MEQTASMMIDSFEPEGITTLAKDSIFMMPHLGVLASVHPAAALEVFERDCLIYLGTCIAPKGQGKPGQTCFEFTARGKGIDVSGTLAVGEMKLIRCSYETEVELDLKPARGFDLGEGRGKERVATVRGGTVGIILDARGRPLVLPTETTERRGQLKTWLNELQVY
jgi:hypothetical protein